MKKKKRKLKIKNFLILFLIIGIAIFLFIFKKANKLESLGYSKNEIEIINKLSNSEIKVIKNNKYNSNILNILNSNNYDKNNLSLYLEYINKYKDTDYNLIMNIINNKDFKEENIDKYVKNINSNENIDSVIKVINNDNADELTTNLISEKYFINDYLDRYKSYYEKNKELSYEEVIKRVNSNLDYTFYDDSKEADITKGMYTLVNKYNYLDKNYTPDNLETITGIYARDTAYLVKDAYDNFILMADSARDEGLTIKVTTGYRNYNFQSTLYNNYVQRDGKDEADTYSARPGYSEHQLGYSADLTNKNNVSFDEFENTKEYEWLQNNAYKYGFIQRYPKDKEYITGFIFESWHYRYVGKDIAKYIYENNLTYEEYYAYFLK